MSYIYEVYVVLSSLDNDKIIEINNILKKQYDNDIQELKDITQSIKNDYIGGNKYINSYKYLGAYNYLRAKELIYDFCAIEYEYGDGCYLLIIDEDDRAWFTNGNGNEIINLAK